mgnify:CR=1 FL=1
MICGMLVFSFRVIGWRYYWGLVLLDGMDNSWKVYYTNGPNCFKGFCLDYQQEDSAEATGKNMEEEAYKLFMKAIEIEDEIIKDINSI